MIVETGRFGRITITEAEEIRIPQGLLGFPECTRFCLVDSGDETLILWLQSIDRPEVVFPVLEPKIFKPDYTVRLSAQELRELQLANVSQSAVFSVLTVPDDVSLMTANLKAPLVLNLREQVGRQVVLQENEYAIKHPMFKELRTHLVSIQSAQKTRSPEVGVGLHPVNVQSIPPSLTVRALQS